MAYHIIKKTEIYEKYKGTTKVYWILWFKQTKKNCVKQKLESLYDQEQLEISHIKIINRPSGCKDFPALIFVPRHNFLKRGEDLVNILKYNGRSSKNRDGKIICRDENWRYLGHIYANPRIR